MKNKYIHITQNSPCPPIKQLELYWQGKLLNAERFEIENHLASCEICNDIIEGFIYLNNANTLPTIENELQLRLEEMLDLNNQKNKRIGLYKRLAFAASFLLIISISFIVYYSVYNKSNIQIFQPIAIADSASKTLQPDSTKPENIKIAQAKKESATHPKSKKSYELTVADQVLDYASESSVSNEIVLAEKEMETPKSADQESPVEINIAPKTAKLSISKDSGKRKVSGIVKDENGMPLPGATISLDGSGNGVVSDADGKFEIAIDKNDKELNINYIGYVSESRNLNIDSLEIKMQPSLVALDEVVVMGYAVQKKSQVTGAISRVMSSDMEKPVTAKRMRELHYSNDTLKQDLNNSMNKWLIVKQLAENYIELHEASNAIDALNNLNRLIEDTVRQDDINKIIILVQAHKYNKALRKLKKLKKN